jgi:pimeloyl-ACP methyl ester carboxylesterase
MSPRSRVARKVLKAFLPIILVIVLAVVIVTGVIVYLITHPKPAAYRVTPQTFTKVTGTVLNATDATWKNHDGADARGWLIKGGDGSPAVILLHQYGADRSWVLNLAVKLNESTNFTVLLPDLRGHGENPSVRWTLFGGPDGDDATAAIEYLRTLKTANGQPQVGRRIGVYGIELGAYAALDAARRSADVRALALDSVPESPDDVIRNASDYWSGMKSVVLEKMAQMGVRVYALGKYQKTPSCDLARSLRDVRVLLLSGGEGDMWRRSTVEMEPCLNPRPEVKSNLMLTGTNLPNGTGEQEESYDRPVIEFFDKALR